MTTCPLLSKADAAGARRTRNEAAATARSRWRPAMAGTTLRLRGRDRGRRGRNGGRQPRGIRVIGLQVPAAAQGLVDVDIVDQEVEARAGERDLRGEELLHGVENLEVVREAGVVAELRQPAPSSVNGHRALE